MVPWKARKFLPFELSTVTGSKAVSLRRVPQSSSYVAPIPQRALQKETQNPKGSTSNVEPSTPRYQKTLEPGQLGASQARRVPATGGCLTRRRAAERRLMSLSIGLPSKPKLLLVLLLLILSLSGRRFAFMSCGLLIFAFMCVRFATCC